MLSRLLTFVALSLALHQASAIPVYYTFDGVVTRSFAAGFDVGTELHWVFMVDRDRDGYISQNGHSVEDQDFFAPDRFADYFLSGLVSGNVLQSDRPEEGGSVQYHSGNEQGGAFSRRSYVTGSNADDSGEDYASVLSFGTLQSEWAVGQTGFYAQNSTFLKFFDGVMTLTAISEEPPVVEAIPEPSAMAMMGLGLLCLGLGLYDRRRRK